MNLSLTLLLSTLTAISASTSKSTTVSILEFGPKGTVHSTTASSPLTSIGGVTSFWNAVHNTQSNTHANGNAPMSLNHQYPGMTVVPDLFSKPSCGVVLGVVSNNPSNPSVSNMETLQTLLNANHETHEAKVGQFHLQGAQAKTLLRTVPTSHIQSSDELESIPFEKISSLQDSNGLASVVVHVENEESAAEVDAALKQTLEAISARAKKEQKSILVHLIVEEDAKHVSHRRLSTHGTTNGNGETKTDIRKLNEDEDDERDENENGNNEANEAYAGMYAYFDEDTNEMVYPYKTMFQIQYYNIVLWTSIGLIVILATANLMTMNMPLMADTLLFGESAKMVAE